VTARCRITVYSESRISRRYLIDAIQRKWQKFVRHLEVNLSFEFRRYFPAIRCARRWSWGTREDAQSLARGGRSEIAFRHLVRCFEIAVELIRGPLAKYTWKRRSWIMKSARSAENAEFSFHLFVIVCIYGNLQTAWLVPDYVNAYLPIEFSSSLASNLYVARRALTYTIVFTPREYENVPSYTSLLLHVLSLFLSFRDSLILSARSVLASACHSKSAWRSFTRRETSERGRGTGEF